MPQPVKFKTTLAAIVLGALAVYLIGNQRVSLWDRDEPMYAQCSREMIQSGDWVVPHYLGQWRAEKPPLIYWCQVAAMTVMGETDEAVRFPSTLAVIATGILLALMVRHFAGERRALWSIFIFYTSGLAIASAKFCITDAVLMIFIAIGQACLGLMYSASLRGKRPAGWVAPIFWIATGLSGLTKGPQALGMHAVLMLSLLLLQVGGKFRSRAAWRSAMAWWRFLQPAIGLPILAVVIAPWMIMIHQRAPGFIYTLFHKAALHSATNMNGHGQPPGYYAVLVFGTFFPWSLLLPTSLVIAWRKRHVPMIRFAMAAVAGPWLLMELITTKLPFYVLPAFPGLAFLTADALVRCMRGQFDDLKRKGFFAGVVVWAVAALAISGSPWLIRLMPRQFPLPLAGMTAFTVGGVLYVAIVALRFSQKRLARAAVAMGVGMAFMMVILYSTIFPNLQFVRISERLVDDLAAVGACGRDVPLAMVGYWEPSLAYYQGGGARRVEDNFLQIAPPQRWPRWIDIDQVCWDRVSPQVQRQFRVVAAEWGINYSASGRSQTVLILENLNAGK